MMIKVFRDTEKVYIIAAAFLPRGVVDSRILSTDESLFFIFERRSVIYF